MGEKNHARRRLRSNSAAPFSGPGYGIRGLLFGGVPAVIVESGGLGVSLSLQGGLGLKVCDQPEPGDLITTHFNSPIFNDFFKAWVI